MFEDKMKANIYINETKRKYGVCFMEERRKLIQKEVEEKGEVRVAYLSEKYNCSEVTIRNDIKVLDQEGVLKRVHGRY